MRMEVASIQISQQQCIGTAKQRSKAMLMLNVILDWCRFMEMASIKTSPQQWNGFAK